MTAFFNRCNVWNIAKMYLDENISMVVVKLLQIIRC